MTLHDSSQDGSLRPDSPTTDQVASLVETDKGSKADDLEMREALSVHPIIRQIIDRDCHVSWTPSEVIRHVVSKLKHGFDQFREMTLEQRQSLIDQCLQQHSSNQRLYVEVMTGFFRTTAPQPQPQSLPTSLKGSEIVGLMRKHKTTISKLAQRMGITQQRIRQVRGSGLSDPLAIRDWIQGITGEDPGPIPTRIRIEEALHQPECQFCGFPFRSGEEAWDCVQEVFCSVDCCRKSRSWLK